MTEQERAGLERKAHIRRVNEMAPNLAREASIAEYTRDLMAAPNNKKGLETGLADRQVLEFIAKFAAWMPDDENDIINRQFAQGSGYAYYFAFILKAAFGRGGVMLAAPMKDFVWVDNDMHGNAAYDINGLYRDYDALIPIEKFGDALDKRRHVPGANPFDPDGRVDIIIRRYAGGKGDAT